MGKLKWLHISDLHLNRRSVETRRMRKHLIEFLREQDFCCKYLFVTGDLRYAPEGNFGTETVSVLHAIREAVHVETKNTFIVPGNHDVDRGNAHRIKGLQKIWEKGYYDSKNGVILKEQLEAIYSGQSDFNNVMTAFYALDRERSENYQDYCCPHFNVETDDFNVLHLNSTLSYSADHERDLLIATEKLMDVLEKINTDKPTIILTHYSFDFLSRDEQDMVLNLFTDYGVRLWLAGHEHIEMLRKQRDVFYEFQSGNLNYEPGNIKNCILVGEYDTATGEGVIHGYEWDSDAGWKKMSAISRQEDKSKYSFNIRNTDSIATTLTVRVNDEQYRDKIDKLYVFSDVEPESKLLPGLSKAESKNEKQFLGGNSNIREVSDKKLSKIVALPCGKNNKPSVLLKKGEQHIYKGMIHTDNEFAPCMTAEVLHTHCDTIDCFKIQNESISFEVNRVGDCLVTCSMKYNLSRFTDVNDRLYHFRQIKKIQDANSLFIRMVNNEKYNLLLSPFTETEEWKNNIELTDYWIDQMERIASIENYFDIKFRLPQKATEEDYLAIDVLSDSICGKKNRTIPPIPMKKPGFRHRLDLNEEVYIGNGDRLLRLVLFGYTFKPIAQYILPGKYVWKGGLKAWQSKQYSGIPVRVEFEVSYDAGMETDLIRYVPFDVFKDEFADAEIPMLEGDFAAFFEEYTELCYLTQKNWRLYLSYKDSLESLIDTAYYNLISNKKVSNHKLLDKITVNRITNTLVTTGNSLISGIDDTMRFIFPEKDRFSGEYINNLGYLWMLIMNIHSQGGHFPISANKSSEPAYDFQQIRAEAELESDDDFIKLMDLILDCLKDSSSELIEMESWYNLIRNYTYIVARIQEDYYKLAEETIYDIVNKLKEIVENNPSLIHRGDTFDNHVAYILENDPTNIHVFSVNADIKADYLTHKNEAEKHYKLQLMGLRNSEKLSKAGTYGKEAQYIGL